jgi:hypothetical protein
MEDKMLSAGAAPEETIVSEGSAVAVQQVQVLLEGFRISTIKIQGAQKRESAG